MLDHREVAHYLGYKGAALEHSVSELADACEAAFFAACHPRRGARKLLLNTLPFLEDSADLKRHLEHCREGCLIAITLGTPADQLLRQWSAVDMAKAAVGQAVAAVWMDVLVDGYIEQLAEGLSEGDYLTAPFSPGYGDFSLRWQPELLRILGAGRLGISLSAGGMLLPQKSMTAVVGIRSVPAEPCPAKCKNCEKEDCSFRKGERACKY